MGPEKSPDTFNFQRAAKPPADRTRLGFFKWPTGVWRNRVQRLSNDILVPSAEWREFGVVIQ